MTSLKVLQNSARCAPRTRPAKAGAYKSWGLAQAPALAGRAAQR